MGMVDNLLELKASQLGAEVPKRYVGATRAYYVDGDAHLPEIAKPASIFIGGDNRTGKTHLACALLGEWANAGAKCLFATAQQAVDIMFMDGKDYVDEPEFLTIPVLVVDDISALHIDDKSGFTISLLVRLLNLRYGRDLHTVVTSNWTIEQWGAKHGALFRMFEDYTLVELKTPWEGKKE
jgi:DNA replication protein DnaC